MWSILWLFIGGVMALVGVAVLLGAEAPETPRIVGLAMIPFGLWIGGWFRVYRARRATNRRH